MSKGWPTPPTTAEERRRLWAEVGVECDALSADFVALRLPLVGEDSLATRVRAANASGDPMRVTLWDIDRYGVSLDPSANHLFIVENPAIVAASAIRHGREGPPLLCVEGTPTTAAWRFLRKCAAAGVRLSFHCDFDWGGIRIGNLLVSRAGAQPWFMGASDYVAAVDNTDELIEIEERSDEAVWDSGLATAMRQYRRAVFEEQLLERLLPGMLR